MNEMPEDPVQYSAEVNMWMDCFQFGRVPLVQVATTFIIASMAQTLPPCDARIVMTVDGREYSRPVSLVNGMNNSREAMILARDDVSPF